MGNSIAVTIRLDHEVYSHQAAIEAGEDLKGKVIVEVKSLLSPCDLTLEVNGKERTSSTVDDGNLIHDNHCFFRSDVQLQKADKAIDPNTYVIPFKIPLPKSLPASRRYTDEKGSFRIEYQLKLKSQANRNLESSRSFEVASSSRAGEFVPCLLQPKPITPAALGVEGEGKLYLGAHVENTYVFRGQDFKCSLACRNESTLKIERAMVSLEEEYYYTTKAIGGHGKKALFEKDDIRKMTGIRVVGLHPSEIDTKMTDEETIARRMFRVLKSKSNIISIHIPETSKESYSGLVLQVSHFLKFDLITKNAEDSFPSIRMPIHVGSQRPALKESYDDLEDLHVSDSARVKLPMVVADYDHVILGRNAGLLDKEEGFSTIFPVHDNNTPSMSIFREELVTSINDVDFISEKLLNSDWAIFLGSLTPSEFGTIISLAGSEFAQPRIAALMAENYDGDFTCAHCAAAIRNVTPVFRSNMVEGLLPYCSDLSENNHLIRAELSEFEQIIVALHALNEDEDPQPAVTDEHGGFEQNVPMNIVIGSDDVGLEEEKPPSDMTLETELKELAGEPAARNKAPGIKPKRTDILLGVADHPKTFQMISAVKAIVDQGDYDEFCPQVYRLVRKQFKFDQRFLLAPLKDDPHYFREATKLEVIESIGKVFDNFRAQEDCDEDASINSERSGRRNWQKALEDTKSDWELATTIHAYTGTNGNDDSGSLEGPTDRDVCFFKTRHPGNSMLIKSLRLLLRKNPETMWTSSVFRSVEKSLAGRRSFVSDGEGSWRLATPVERRENISRYFELEKKRSLARREGSQHQRTLSGRESSAHHGEKEGIGSGHRRDKEGWGSSHRRDRDTLGSSHRRTPENSFHRRESLSGSVHKRTQHRRESAESGQLRMSMHEGSQSDRSFRRTVLHQADTPLPQASPRPLRKSSLNGEAKGDSRRSSSASKYKVSLAPSSPATLDDKERAKSRSTGTPDKGVGPTIVDTDNNQNNPLSTGTMALNDVHEVGDGSPSKRTGLFRRLSRKASIRMIDKRNMRHPRDMDICYGSETHPGTIALVEAVLKSMHKYGGKGWGTPVYKAIRADTHGRRFFIRPDRDSAWREASAEEQLELTQKLFEAKRRERKK